MGNHGEVRAPSGKRRASDSSPSRLGIQWARKRQVKAIHVESWNSKVAVGRLVGGQEVYRSHSDGEHDYGPTGRFCTHAANVPYFHSGSVLRIVRLTPFLISSMYVTLVLESIPWCTLHSSGCSCGVQAVCSYIHQLPVSNFPRFLRYLT